MALLRRGEDPNTGDAAAVGGAVDDLVALAEGVDVEVYQYRFMTTPKGTPQDVKDAIWEGMQATFETEEYQAFTWTIRREEIPIVGSTEEDLEKAGFRKEPGGSGYSRPQTDDSLSGADEHVEKPEGQFKSRVILTVRWHAENADEDREFSIETYLPVNGEEEEGGGGPGGLGTPGADGNSPPGTGSAGNETLDRSGSVKKG